MERRAPVAFSFGIAAYWLRTTTMRGRHSVTGQIRASHSDRPAPQTEQRTMPRRDQQDQGKADRDNHSRRLNPQHDAFWQSRRDEARPEDWRQRLPAEKPEKA